jgi:hypothetical protein
MTSAFAGLEKVNAIVRAAQQTMTKVTQLLKKDRIV